MELAVALKHGHRIRHCNWPPYHYAQLKQGRNGMSELWRFAPYADAELLELSACRLGTDRGWALIDIMSQIA